jgi:hypothetical protein
VSLLQKTQVLVRSVHAALPMLRRRLPDQIAVYFHDLDPIAWNSFSRMVRYLAEEQGYRTTDPLGFVAPSPERRLFISFDDNYRSWYLLREHSTVRTRGGESRS